MALNACSPTSHWFVMHTLRTQLALQYHECVPLGWDPVPVAGTYYPGYSAELQDTNSWLPALWLGSIHTSDLRQPDGRAAYEVLNELVRVGMLERKQVAAAFHYRLTLRAVPYYFDDNEYGDNPEHWPYLCYSRMVPTQVVWNQAIREERYGEGSQQAEAFRVAFEWQPSPVPLWANDATLRSHSVILAPRRIRVIAKFIKRDRQWAIDNLYSSAPFQPYVVDASVWPRLR